jgi:hypothetical protein
MVLSSKFANGLGGQAGQAVGIRRADFRNFFMRQVMPLYYEDGPWRIPCDSLAALLGKSPAFGGQSAGCRELLVVDTFSQHGVLPYNLEQMMRRLTDAFRERDARRILRHSADIGHYIADAHVPLHTTANYNGQLTGQDGLHAFWETRLPEMFAERDYDFWVGQATLIERPGEFFWSIVLDSHALVDSVVGIEWALRGEFLPDAQMCNEFRNNVWLRVPCPEFSTAYHERMGGMVEARMQSAILSVGSAWYTAWVLAGQPDLGGLFLPDSTRPDSTDVELQKAVKRGRQLGRVHE